MFRVVTLFEQIKEKIASCWSYLNKYMTMHGAENAKLLVCTNVKLPAYKIKVFNLDV
jgi:hypothetical protein